MRKLKLMAELSKGACLDIGFAHNSNPFLKDPIGVDIQNIAKPENYKGVYVLNLNTEKLPFSDRSFDTVLAGDVIEHVENPSHLLREINRVLKHNGKLLLSTPHATWWWTVLHNWFFQDIVNDPDIGEHLSNWTVMDMKRLLTLNGFEVIKIWGTECEIPKLGIKIPVKHFPMLGWVVLYETKKITMPVDFIYLNKKDQVIKHYTFKKQERFSSKEYGAGKGQGTKRDCRSTL